MSGVYHNTVVGLDERATMAGSSSQGVPFKQALIRALREAGDTLAKVILKVEHVHKSIIPASQAHPAQGFLAAPFLHAVADEGDPRNALYDGGHGGDCGALRGVPCQVSEEAPKYPALAACMTDSPSTEAVLPSAAGATCQRNGGKVVSSDSQWRQAIPPMIHVPFVYSQSGEGVALLLDSQDTARAAPSLTNRLAEAESPWLLADLVSGEETCVVAGLEDLSPVCSSPVVVSSVESLASIDEEEGAAGDTSFGASRPASPSSAHRVIHFQMEEELHTPQRSRVASSATLRDPPGCSQYVYRMQGAGGWAKFKTFRGLARFVRNLVSHSGTAAIARTRFVLPAAEVDKLLDVLEDITPVTFQDVVRAAKAAATRVAAALTARIVLAQVAELVIGWVATAEESAAAAVAAGEVAAAAGSSCSALGVCSTLFAVTPWVIIVGGCVYAVVRCVYELKYARRRSVVSYDAAEAAQGFPDDCDLADSGDLCVVEWSLTS